MRFVLLFVGISIAGAIDPAHMNFANLSPGGQLVLIAYTVVLDIVKKW